MLEAVKSYITKTGAALEPDMSNGSLQIWVASLWETLWLNHVMMGWIDC